jgi:hypothetical protein
MLWISTINCSIKAVSISTSQMEIHMKLIIKRRNYKAVAVAVTAAIGVKKIKLRNRIWILEIPIRNLKEIQFQ